MMGMDAIEDDLARRFRIDRPQTLLARKSSKARIGFSRMRSCRSMRGRSLAARPEDAFAFHVPMSVPFFTRLWTAGRRREVPDSRLGYAQLVDLRDNPVVGLDTPFDSTRFYIPQIALDEMADETGILATVIWSCSVWHKRLPPRWSTPARVPLCFPIVSHSPFSLTLCGLTATSQPREVTLVAASHPGSCSAPATSSMPTWRAILQSPN
jgi:hypothetical protein